MSASPALAYPDAPNGPAAAGSTTAAPRTLVTGQDSPLQSLAINDVLDFKGKLVRLIAANPRSDTAYLIEVFGFVHRAEKPKRKPALPFASSYRELRTHGIRSDDPAWARPLESSVAVQAIREKRYARIKELITSPGVLDAKTRGPILKNHAIKVSVSKKTLLEDLRAWWQHGQVKDALLGDYHRCGRVTDSTPGALVLNEKSINHEKHIVLAPVREHARGRRPIGGGYTPMNLTQEEKQKILKVGRDHYEKDKTVSMRSVVARVVNDLYAPKTPEGTPLKDAQGNPALPPLGRRPTHRQISYLLSVVLPVAKTYMRRHGAAEYLNNRAPTTGTVLDDCIGPADVYECDDTTFDYHISSESDITVIVGKATLHIVVDRYSRFIPGFHLSLDASCWEDAKLALLSVCNDWKAMCEKHGIKYDPADFPAQGVICNRYFSDRGPYLTFASDEMVNAGNDSTNAPALLSRSKPIVESTFRRFNKLISEVPGYEPQWNVTKRRRKPYEAAACLTLTQLEGIVLRAVITLNREVLRDYPQSPADNAKKLLPIPREIWAREVERLNSLPRRISREWLRNALLSRDVATVTQDGIRFMGNYYTCKEAVQKDWFSIASIGSNFEVAVRYTPKNLDEILVQDKHRKDVQFVARLTTKSLQITGNTPGLTDTRSAEIAEQKRAIRREAEIKNNVQRVGFVQDVALVVAAAQEKMLAATKGHSLASRKNKSLEIREVEAQQHRVAKHRVTSEEPFTAKPEPATTGTPPADSLSLTPVDAMDEALQAIAVPGVMNDFLEALEKI